MPTASPNVLPVEPTGACPADYVLDLNTNVRKTREKRGKREEERRGKEEKEQGGGVEKRKDGGRRGKEG